MAWVSSNTSVATISSAAGSSGLATALATGTSTITATAFGVSGMATLTVVGPPTISGLSTNSATQGAKPLTLSIAGANFVSGSVVLWNGAKLSTVFLSSGSLKATIPASDLAHAGTAILQVSNPGNLTSSGQLFTIIGTGPPAVTGITGSQSSSGLVSITVSFNEPMSMGSVQNASLYTVLGAVTKKGKTKYSKSLSFHVAYNARAMTATLTLSAPYKGGAEVTVKSGIRAANNLASKKSFSTVVA